MITDDGARWVVRVSLPSSAVDVPALNALFDAIADAAYEWEQKLYPERDGWDIDVCSGTESDS